MCSQRGKYFIVKSDSTNIIVLLINTLVIEYIQNSNCSVVLIYLFVSDPPEISVERPVVHSGEGFEAQLVCIVHGESQPEV